MNAMIAPVEPPAISWFRDKTNILDEDTLQGVVERFSEFAALHNGKNREETFSLFFAPRNANDFAKFKEKEIIHDGKKHFVIEIFGESWLGKSETLERACTYPDARYGLFCGVQEVAFPIDSDLRIRVTIAPEDRVERDESTFFGPLVVKDTSVSLPSLMVSYNELEGLTGTGRDPHWSEGGIITAERLKKNPNASGTCDPLYRKTPVGQPTVADLIKRGHKIETSYGTGPYIVSAVNGPYITSPDERPDDYYYESYSLSLVDVKSKKGGYGINGLVAVDGKILYAFMENQDEVFILETGCEVPKPVRASPDDEDDEDNEFFDEEEYESCGCAIQECDDDVYEEEPKASPVQISEQPDKSTKQLKFEL